MRRAMLALAVLLLAAASALAQDKVRLTPREFEGLFRGANELFQKANALRRTKPSEAKELYGRAIVRLETIADRGGVRNGKLFYDLGNACFFAGRLGRAILWYRRAGRLIPGDANLRQSLAFARSRLQDKFETPTRRRVLRTLLFFHYDVGFGARWGLFVAAWALTWVLLAVRVWVKRTGALAWAAGVCGALAAVLLLSCVAETLDRASTREGVVIAREVVGRKGDAASYDPAFRGPLHEGAEFTLLEERGGWRLVRLADGRECWLPAGSCEMVGRE